MGATFVNNKKPMQLKLDVHDPQELEQLKSDNKRLKEEIKQLQIENIRLKTKINQITESQEVYRESAEILMNRSPSRVLVENPMNTSLSQVTRKSSIEEKVALFRFYFKGRDDVYAVRAVDKKGKTVYFTKRHYLGKENGKHLWGANLPLTDEVIRTHLEDENTPVTIGMYPMLLDETCWFLAIDFDKFSWMEDATAFLEVSRSLSVPAALERSRSGNGGHVWIFFR